MKRSHKVCIGVVLAATLLAGGCAALHADGTWLVRTTIDRFNPLASRHTVYAPAPGSQECIEVYDDATGSGKNYVYKMRGVTDEGSERECFFVSFGSPMEVSEPYVEIATVGSHAQTVRPKTKAEVPESLREPLARIQ